MSRADVLKSAVRAAIKNKVPRKSICVPAWATTYGVPQKLVREVWEAELTKETNSNPMGEGK